MPHVQALAGGIRKLDQPVELGPFVAGNGGIGLCLLPVGLPLLFNGRKIVIHARFSLYVNFVFANKNPRLLYAARDVIDVLPPCFRRRSLRGAPCLSYKRRRCNGAHPSRPVQAESSGTSTTERPRRLAPYAGSLRVDDLCLFPFIASDNIEVYFSAFLPNVNPVFRENRRKHFIRARR